MQDIPAHPITSLLEGLLAESPSLVRARQLLPALDWRHARADQVADLISRLNRADMQIPRWLAEDLLSAGHTVPDDMLAADCRELGLLSTLNGSGVSSATAAELAGDLEAMGAFDQMPPKVAQQSIARLCALGQATSAVKLALGAYAAAPEGLRAVKPHIEGYIASLPEVRIRVGGASTTQALAAALRYTFAANGLRASISDGGYGSLMTELVQPGQPSDALVLLLDQSHFMPRDWRRDPEQLRADLEERLSSLASAVASFCARSGGGLIVTMLPPVFTPSAGYADHTFAAGAARVHARVNQVLGSLADENPRLSLLDTGQALAALPPKAHVDPKLWFYGRFAYSEAATRHIASAAARLWHSRLKGPAKVLALDFDNTLWGGVFGDDGIAKLQCGDDFPGSAYKAFQNECLRLKAQGMILVGLSKNNADALDVFGKHPGVLLRRDDFVAAAVDWNPKPDNVRKLASQLRLGLDAFVFLDDSPHERAAMRRMCPDVRVPEMPSDPAARPQWLRALHHTWPTRITGEDAKRSSYYASELKHRELRAASGTYEDYLTGLEQRLTIQPLTASILPRVAQLHQRTNQFNLTNERYGESDLARPAEPGQVRLVYAGTVEDRFGDHGLVIACAIDLDGGNAILRSFVMSCRVIGRQVESEFLGALLRQMQGKNIRSVTGLFKPTAKNAVAAKLYADFGFTQIEAKDGFEAWRMELEGLSIPPSRVVQTHWSNEEC
ncbi:MAG TPA: HAD-IIIC family phosphatase [Hyphomicrobium sp.]|nr:HAD-IIIC family phosphatase [Hyphomicrobium sp.]